MCGIAGGFGIDRMTLGRMVRTLQHRGPDDEGLFLEGPVALGNRRLAILDLPGGRQPMSTPDGCLALTFNGEIYNFRELRRELEDSGHRFHTRSDTEVLLHAYEEWGTECLRRLRGMFAFCILDRSETWPAGDPKDTGCRFAIPQGPGAHESAQGIGGRLFLARDRLGIKPLYWFSEKGLFLFASEVRALLATGRVPFRLSPEALYSYLLFGSVQEPLTLIEGVLSLSPAHAMTVDLATGEVRAWRYWDWPAETWEGTPEEAVREVREVLKEAVCSHLVADVPLGVFLSGGLDSAALVALATEAGEPVHTFTLVFEEEAFNEGEVARRTARLFGANHREVFISASELLASLPQAVEDLDQPTMDGINTWFVSRAAREAGLKVALSGVGGDELFAGYSTFGAVPRMARLRALLGSLGRPLAPLSGLLPLGPDARRKARSLLEGDLPFHHPYFLARALFPPRVALARLSPEARDALPKDSPWRARVRETLERAERMDPVNAVSYLECNHYMLSTLLRDTDQMSMAHSLEVRVPFLDHRVVERVLALPGPRKVRDSSGRRKPLLVSALNGLLPGELALLPKRTFTLPWEVWLKGPLRKEVEEVLGKPPEALKGLIDPDAVRSLWEEYLKGHTTWSRPWALYVLYQWVDKRRG